MNLKKKDYHLPELSYRPILPLFTIVELLVVISIIAVLMTILLPALRQAKESAKRLTCMNQEKQLWHGFNDYSEDNNEWVISWRLNPGPRYWPYYLREYLDLPRQTGFPPATLLMCPSDKNLTSRTAASTVLWSPSSYGINQYTYVDKDTLRYRRPQVKRPSQWCVFMDAEALIFVIGYGTSTFGLRHNNGVNALFFDGHVSYYPLGDIPTTQDSFYTGK